jgi:CRISPR-associated endoribonuclease Cas6
LHFQLYPLRFSFVAREAIYFPPGKSANILRGAFGTIFRRIACQPQCSGAQQCEIRSTCAYARMFEPSALGPGPSGLADWPRPFVFRATHLDGRAIPRDEPFQFDLNLFDMKSPALAYLVLAFTQLAHEGLGPGRGRATLTRVSQHTPPGVAPLPIYDGATFPLCRTWPPLVLSLAPEPVPVDRVRVRFVTPTELKGGQQLAPSPEFAILFGRIRDRLSTLREMYGEGPLDIDFRGLGERAAKVRMTRCELNQMEITRRSSKTGKCHSIGGFVGDAEYEGELAEFVPYLKAAKWTGVGRQTVWGKGEMELQ